MFLISCSDLNTGAKGVRWSKASEKSLLCMYDVQKLICQLANSCIILLKVHFVQVLLKNLFEIIKKAMTNI